MPAGARIALLALLIAGAVFAVRAPDADLAPPSRTRARPGDPDEAIAWMMLLVVPALALLTFAALRYRRAMRQLRNPRRSVSPPSWRAALIALAALILISVGLGLLGRLSRPEPRKRSTGSDSKPGDAPSGSGRPEDPAARSGDGLDIELWSAVVAGILLLLLILSLINRRGPAVGPPEPDAEPPGTAPQPPLAVAAERALAAVDQPTGDPREAIIRCYAAMERALADAPASAPQPSDTPTDVLQRATETGQLRGAEGGRLVRLFTEARYSRHPMTDANRDTAASTLRAILNELRGPVWTRS